MASSSRRVQGISTPSPASPAGPPGPSGRDELPPPPWRQGAAKPARQQLSVEAIVEAAMKIIEAEGLDAMSMRRVAQALNTGPASLYAHVRNKRDLCELLLEAAFQDLRIPVPDAANWRRELRAYVLELTRVMLEKPGIARIAMETMIPTSPRMLLGMDAMMGILRGAGFPDKYVSHACDALALYSTAYAYERSLWATTAKSQAEAQRRVVEIEAYLDSIPAEKLPHMTALRTHLRHDDGFDHFTFAVDIFIAGIAAYIADHSPAGSAE